MLWLAHDGSLNADWLSHYAVRFARQLPEPVVCALHVHDGSLAEAEFERRILFLRRECERAEVGFSTERLLLKGSVAHTLLSRVPAGPDSYLLCGTRVRPRNFSFLVGTVSEQLLARARCNTLAVRVVQPGMLGAVHRVLLPVMGHPDGFKGIPFLRLFNDLQDVHVLLVRERPRLLRQALANRFKQSSETAAEAYVAKIREQLGRELNPQLKTDSTVLVSRDIPAEIVLSAKQHKSELIYLGASERGIAQRVLSGAPGEEVLRHASCDVAIYRGVT